MTTAPLAAREEQVTSGSPSALVEPLSSQLLLVDVQQRLVPAMSDREALMRNAAILLTAASELGVPVTISEQYPEGLGPTVPELAELTDRAPLPKREFSCLRNPALRARLADGVRRDLIVAGVEAHVCVLQTALDAAAMGLRVFLVADAVASRRPESRERALRRAEQAGCFVVTTEMVLFEWLQTADAPAFRRLSKLIR